LYLWVALLVLVPTGNAITALTFAQYILQPAWPTCEPPYEAVRLLAAVITCKYCVLSTDSVAPEPEGSSPHSQQPANGPYPEPGESTCFIHCFCYLASSEWKRCYGFSSSPLLCQNCLE
jgi:hypothetical protein